MKKDIIELIDQKNYEKACEMIAEMQPKEIATMLNNMDESHVMPICRNLDSDTLADVLLECDKELKNKIIESLRDNELEEVMDEVSIDETIDLISDISHANATRIVDSEEVEKLIANKDYTTLKSILSNMNEMDIAEIFGSLNSEEIVVLFRLLPKDLAADTFVEMDNNSQEALIGNLSNIELKTMMDELFIDDMVDIVEEMPANVVKRILSASDKETRQYINEILKYPKDSAGSVMTIEFVSLSPDMTVEDAFDKIRKTAIDKETVYTCYVTDTKKKLIGVVSARELMMADKTKQIRDIMHQNVIYSNTLDDKEDVVRKISNYGFVAMPIVDEEKRLVGIVTVDDAMDIMIDENSEDIAKMAAITPSDKTYLKTSVFEIWKNRIPWLLILMVSATFTGLIINVYEAKLNAISSVLFACVPMMMDTGGNSGSQASVTIIRSLALNELSSKDIFKVLWKELRASILLGATLSVACLAKLLLIDNLLFGYSGYTFIRCAVISIALFATVVIAKVVGCVLPMIAKKCHLDPAVVASPFITTIVDALSLILYCWLSIAILG